MRIVTPLFVSLLLCGIPAVACSATDPSTDDEKSFYALGLIISQSLSPFALTESELNLVKTGMTDGVLKKTPKVDLQTYGPKVNQIQQTRVAAVADNEKKAGAAFLEKAAKDSGAKKTESGAIVTTIKDQPIRIRDVGRAEDGTKEIRSLGIDIDLERY